ncbi:glycoside hydrolase family 10 protein [Roseateles violae]|uniref:Family 10 glycosylhydrolase n=1 Tax=Roseateles violae TaxID=3058042 RepID=A0ABT8DSX9_9BURK|nr:family 10 glycosylhydrolase [Pelomonas sp. PFR6]MDN3919457.1 family 10 glycosylhydrolase [Pelomonas sp. PFR6]
MVLSRRTLLAAPLALSACAERPLFGPSLKPAPELAALAPAAPREFRAAWVATVANIDWPSKKGLSTAEQQAEMHAMLDRAVELKLNAIIFQVRTSADALYDSKLEPWSEYLSGSQGQAPEPFYDPLALWIAEAHKRGLELHAWFNPFRARQSGARSALAATHLGKTRPDWVKSYGDQLWLDPGEPGAAEHSLAVFKDVLQRYDVDGIHIDDYFYPYAVNDPATKQEIDFPDEPSWQRYLKSGGTLGRADWRRQNVDTLIVRIYKMVAATKPQVRFGISPFGIGKPALRPAGIAGFSQYDKLYADVERWLAEGWLDYLVPQLYWPRAQQAQAFGPLLDYWHGQNARARHVWPGLYTSRITDKPESWPVDEITGQIALQRQRAPANGTGAGHVHFSMIALQQNRRGLVDALKAGTYTDAALVPATPWLAAAGSVPPAAPQPGLARQSNGQWQLSLAAGSGQRCACWLRYGERWEFRAGSELLLSAQGLDAIVVSAIDRLGIEGPRVAYRLA